MIASRFAIVSFSRASEPTQPTSAPRCPASPSVPQASLFERFFLDRPTPLLEQQAEQVKRGIADPDGHLAERLIQPVQAPGFI